MPPCPGMEFPKSLILKALLKPEAKNPPKGAKVQAKSAMTNACSWTGAIMKVLQKGKVNSIVL